MQFFIVLNLFFSVLSADYLSDFNKARTLYDSGNYAEALAGYMKVEKINPGNSFIYFNIANTYYKMSKYGYAKAYYLKALKIEPRNPDFIHNLKIVNLKLGIQEKKSFIKEIINYVSFDEIAIFNASVFFCLFLVVVFYTLLRKKGKIVLNSLLLFFAGSLFIVFIIGLFFVYVKKEINSEFSAVAVSPSALNAAPSDSSTLLLELPLGANLKLEKKESEWYKVIYDQEYVGWVKKEKLLEI